MRSIVGWHGSVPGAMTRGRPVSGQFARNACLATHVSESVHFSAFSCRLRRIQFRSHWASGVWGAFGLMLHL